MVRIISIVLLFILPMSLFGWKMESGKVSLPATAVGSSTWQAITLQQTYDTTPLIFVLVDQGSGYDGDSPVALRIRNITASSFEVVQVEPQSSVGDTEGEHAAVNLDYIAIEAGDHTLEDGTRILALTQDTSDYQGKKASGTKSWDSVSFSSGFSASPIILGTIQTLNNEVSTLPGAASSPWMTVAIRNVDSNGFQMALDRAETSVGSITVDETVAYLAVDANVQGSLYEPSCTKIDYETILTSDSVRGWRNGCYSFDFVNTYSALPNVIGNQETRNGPDGGWLRRCALGVSAVDITIDEDQANDSDRSHTTEIAGLAIFENDFIYDSSTVSACIQANNDYIYTQTNIAVSGNVMDNDIGLSIQVTSNTSPSSGILTGVNADGTYSYDPGSFVGSDSFEYTITDIEGMVSTATVYITVEAPIDIDATLMAEYRMDACGFDHSSGDAIDNSINLLNGTSNGSLQLFDKTTSGSYLCNSGYFQKTGQLSDGFISIDDASQLQFTDVITASAWVKAEVLGSDWSIVAGKFSAQNWVDGWGLFHWGGHANELGFIVYTNGTYSYVVGTVSLNTWTHIVGTYDGTNIKFYINGVEAESRSKTGNIDNTAATLDIGAGKTDTAGTNNEAFEGYIDETKVFNRALTASEVAIMYDNESSGRNWNSDTDTRVCNTCSCSAENAKGYLVSIAADFRNMSSDKSVSDYFTGSWQLYRRDYQVGAAPSGSNNAVYYVMQSNDDLEYGKAYWLKNNTGVDANWSVSLKTMDFNATITDYPNCRSNNGKCTLVDLVSPNGTDNQGSYIYTMTSFPISKSINWRDVRILIDGVSYTPDQAAALGETFNATIWRYNGTGTSHANSYDNVTPGTPGLYTTINPCVGYWIKLDKGTAGKDVKLLIPQE